MDYEEKIKEAIEKGSQNLNKDREIRDNAIAVFQQREKEEQEPIKLLIQEYLDFNLKDANGVTIKDGDVVSSKIGLLNYKVIKRGMQFVFGIPMFNPSVEVLAYDINKQQVKGKKVKQLHKSDLSEMIIMSTDVVS